MAFIKPAALPAFLEHGPDQVVVLVSEGEVGAAELRQAQLADDLLHGAGNGALRAVDGDHLVGVLGQLVAQGAQHGRIVPVHPVAQADRLLGLQRGKAQHPLLTQVDEAGQAVLLDVALGGEAQVALDVDLDPQALAVEAVLVALVVALHGVEALVDVLVGAPPGMMHAHRPVGRDRAIDKGPALVALVHGPESAKGVGLAPEVQDGMFLSDEIWFRGNGLEHNAS